MDNTETNIDTNTDTNTDTNIDTNIDNYSVEDIYAILNLQNPSEYQIKDAANSIISQMRSQGNFSVASFFEGAKDKALDSFKPSTMSDSDNEQNDDNTQIGNWWTNQFPAQSNKIQANKATDRTQKIQTFDDNSHFQMNRERLGVNESHPIQISQGTINPNFKQTTTRMVTIDSQFRQNILPYSNNDPNSPSFNTDYTLDLSDPLTNVISMKLYSIQIPTTWYTFDKSLGNVCFEDVSGNVPDISYHMVDPGNYTPSELPTAPSGYAPLLVGGEAFSSYDISYMSQSGKYAIGVKDGLKGGGDISFVYYRPNGINDPSGQCYTCSAGAKIDQNLGWNMGFRRDPDASGVISVNIPAFPNKIIADVPADTYGPKYFVLVVDDYNQNRLNKGLVNIIERPTKLNLPDYYTPDLSCINQATNTSRAVKSAPRKLTQAQLYSINEILSNRMTPSLRTKPPNTSDSLAVIPLRNITSIRPQPYIDNSPSLQHNKRTYFGPVDIDRLRVKLLDDKGNLVNLHDNNWSFCLIVEQLYEY
jgi:hypothetical protein